MLWKCCTQFSSVELLSSVWRFVTSWTAARQASLSITNARRLLKLMSIELVMPSYHLILCRPLLLLPSIFPTSGCYPVSQFFASDGQTIGASASASVFSMNIRDWFPLWLTGLISLQSKDSQKSSPKLQLKHQFFGNHLSLQSNSHIHT